MKVALFVPCYIDTFFPEVALATLKLLEKQNIEVVYPYEQKCCGQPYYNSGFHSAAKDFAKHFIHIFEPFEYIVAPSASCIATIKRYKEFMDDKGVGERSFEICEFLVDIVKEVHIDATFPKRVGLHHSCHGLRELHLSKPSEIVAPYYSKPLQLLKQVKGIEIVDLDRVDECCGFGGVFTMMEPEISIQMGKDRIEDHKRNGAEAIVGYDMSCLMHMQGIAQKEGIDTPFYHITQILAGMSDGS